MDYSEMLLSDILVDEARLKAKIELLKTLKTKSMKNTGSAHLFEANMHHLEKMLESCQSEIAKRNSYN